MSMRVIIAVLLVYAGCCSYCSMSLGSVLVGSLCVVLVIGCYWGQPGPSSLRGVLVILYIIGVSRAKLFARCCQYSILL